MSHEKPGQGETDTWLTPPEVLKALGEFDLDPCAAPDPKPWTTANRHITFPTDGLLAPWEGRVWCNPPFSDVERWVRKCAGHGNAIALVGARIETDWFRSCVWRRAKGVFFFHSRIHFYLPNGKLPEDSAPGFPVALVAYDSENVDRIGDSPLDGELITSWRRTGIL